MRIKDYFLILFILINCNLLSQDKNSSAQFALVNGVKIHYKIWGEGKPLLLLHGNSGSMKSRMNIIPTLAKSYKVIAMDSRGHGLSENGSGDLNYRDMAKDVAEFLDYLKLEKVNIWGHSDGGIIALILGFTAPEKIEKIIISGANYMHGPKALEPELDALVKRYDEIKYPRLKRQVKLMLDQPNISLKELNSITIPTLVMVGDRDAVLLEHTISLFHNLPKANLCVLPATTHMISNERPDQMLYWLNDFINKPFRSPSSVDMFKKVAEQILKKE